MIDSSHVMGEWEPAGLSIESRERQVCARCGGRHDRRVSGSLRDMAMVDQTLEHACGACPTGIVTIEQVDHRCDTCPEVFPANRVYVRERAVIWPRLCGRCRRAAKVRPLMGGRYWPAGTQVMPLELADGSLLLAACASNVELKRSDDYSGKLP